MLREPVTCTRRSISTLHEGFVEADLTAVGRGVAGPLVLISMTVIGPSGGDGGGAPLAAVGEVEKLAEAAAGLDGGDRLAQQGHRRPRPSMRR
mgnify:CR=1 FL=1